MLQHETPSHMYHVLLPVDEDLERADAQVEYLESLPIEREDVQVTVAHSYADDPHGDEPVEPPASLLSARERLEATAFAVEEREISGTPEEGIPLMVDDLGADAVVMSGRKRSPAGKALFGSVAQSVILTTDRPVTIVDTAE